MTKPHLKTNSISATRVETANIVLPSHTNHMGTMFGGIIMQWIDVTAAISATRHACGQAVTASMDRMHFLRPLHVEEIVHVIAETVLAGRTSMEVEVEVWSENPWSQERNLATRAYLTFVAVDEEGKPRPVGAIRPVTAGERRRQKAAIARRVARLRERRSLG